VKFRELDVQRELHSSPHTGATLLKEVRIKEQLVSVRQNLILTRSSKRSPKSTVLLTGHDWSYCNPGRIAGGYNTLDFKADCSNWWEYGSYTLISLHVHGNSWLLDRNKDIWTQFTEQWHVFLIFRSQQDHFTPYRVGFISLVPWANLQLPQILVLPFLTPCSTPTATKVSKLRFRRRNQQPYLSPRFRLNVVPLLKELLTTRLIRVDLFT